MNAPAFLPEGMKPAHGLYDPRNEHDACGIGLYANIHNKKSHDIVSKGLLILKNLEHRGAVGADPETIGSVLCFFSQYHQAICQEITKFLFCPHFHLLDLDNTNAR